ncbi:hypothetical protein LCGC14_3025510, partial [marine sediment metagenome]
MTTNTPHNKKEVHAIDTNEIMQKIRTNIDEKISTGIYPENTPEILNRELISQNTDTVSSSIEQMKNTAQIKADYFLPSTRPIAGPLINIAKKFIGKLLYLYNKDFVTQINAFNHNSSKAIEELRKLNDRDTSNINSVALWQENYERFEDNFRGDSKDLKKSLSNYLQFFKKQSKVIDIGCGRGEFLQLLKENNIDSYGVDTSQVMVDSCIKKGLSVKKGDAIDHLEQVEPNSLGGIFSSQVVEHIKSHEVLRIIELSHQMLKPGSHLVIETLNPQCITVLNNNFTIDLSHERIIHPQTLYFFTKMIGFTEVEVKY